MVDPPDAGGVPDAGARPLTTDAGLSLKLLAGQLGGPGYADGTQASSRFTSPQALAADSTGNLYVLDGNTLEVINIASGVARWVAGSTLPGSADGPGTAARFDHPLAIALDGQGHLFVADSVNSTLREIDLATDTVSTFAGATGQAGSVDGNGVAARFNGPGGLAIDGSGHLFVSDSCTIREVELATGQVSTLAGQAGQCGQVDGVGANAQFGEFNAMAFDGRGHLVVADSSALRQIDVASGQVTTLLRCGGDCPTAQFIGSVSSLISDQSGQILLSQDGLCAVERFDLSTLAFTAVVGDLTTCGGVEVDGDFAHARFRNLFGLAADGQGHLFVGDTSSVRIIDLSARTVGTLGGRQAASGNVDGVGAQALFGSVSGVAVAGTNAFVVDADNNAMRKVDFQSAHVSTAFSTATWEVPLDMTAALAVDGSGALYFMAGLALYKVDPDKVDPGSLLLHSPQWRLFLKGSGLWRWPWPWTTSGTPISQCIHWVMMWRGDPSTALILHPDRLLRSRVAP